jgi:hypothetical protein
VKGGQARHDHLKQGLAPARPLDRANASGVLLAC